jgi:hypothetical protein
MSWTRLSWRGVLSWSLICFVFATPAKADLIVTAGTPTIATDGMSGTASFYISSNSGSDTLSSFSLEMFLSGSAVYTNPPTNPPPGLQFAPAASQPTVYDQPNYVFSGNSFAQAFALPFWSDPFPPTNGSVPANSYIPGGDTYFDQTFATTSLTLAQSQTYLLASVTFDYTPPPSQTGPVVFWIVFDNNTSFYDDSLNQYQSQDPSSPDYVDMSNSAAEIVLGSGPQTMSTPEPASLLLAGMAGAAGFLYHWRRRQINGLAP